MHHAAAGDLEPAAFERTAHEGDVDLGGRLGEREERGAEAHLQVVALEEAAQEIGDHALEVGEADVLADPQAFDLVEHRRVRGVGVDAIDAARRDDADLGHRLEMLVLLHVLLHVAHLDRAGMRTQQDAFGNLAAFILQVEGVVHGTRRMVVGRVQRGEVVEVVLDLGTVGHFEADRAEQAFDALERARHRVQAATGFAAAGQRDVERLFGEAGFQRCELDRVAARVERGFDRFLGAVDGGAGGLLLFGRQLAEALQEFGDLARLAEVAGLDLLQRVGVVRCGKGAAGFIYDCVEIMHFTSTLTEEKKEANAPPFFRTSG